MYVHRAIEPESTCVCHFSDLILSKSPGLLLDAFAGHIFDVSCHEQSPKRHQIVELVCESEPGSEFVCFLLLYYLRVWLRR